MVGEPGQGEQQTQLAVVVLTGTELLQGVETLDGLLHGELQLERTNVHISLTNQQQSQLEHRSCSNDSQVNVLQ